jgi:hypothetical protein
MYTSEMWGPWRSRLGTWLQAESLLRAHAELRLAKTKQVFLCTKPSPSPYPSPSPLPRLRPPPLPPPPLPPLPPPLPCARLRQQHTCKLLSPQTGLRERATWFSLRLYFRPHEYACIFDLHTHAHTCTPTHTHPRTHTRNLSLSLSLSLALSLSLSHSLSLSLSHNTHTPASSTQNSCRTIQKRRQRGSCLPTPFQLFSTVPAPRTRGLGALSTGSSCPNWHRSCNHSGHLETCWLINSRARALSIWVTAGLRLLTTVVEGSNV